MKSALDDLQKTRKTFEARVSFTQDLGKLSEVGASPYRPPYPPSHPPHAEVLSCLSQGKGDYVDIREEVENKEKIIVSKGESVLQAPMTI